MGQLLKGRRESENPLGRLEDWEDFVETRYPAPGGKPREDYRNFDPRRATPSANSTGSTVATRPTTSTVLTALR